MSGLILVGYATRYGSTQEVAEAIAAGLRAGGLEVEVKPLAKVRTLEGYRAVVVGAPLYIGSLLKDARRFLAQQQEALSTRPAAFFALGPLSADEKEIQGGRAELDKELAKYPWFKPVEIALFPGKFDPKKLRFPDSLIAVLPASPLYKAPAKDERDWTAIRAWASQLALKL